MIAVTMPIGKRTLVLAEDDDHMRGLVTALAQRAGFAVRAFADGDAFWTWASLVVIVGDGDGDGEDVALIITDVNMPGRNGLDVIALLVSRGSRIPTIVITAFGDDDTHARAEALGARVLDKPFDVSALRVSFAHHAIA